MNRNSIFAFASAFMLMAVALAVPMVSDDAQADYQSDVLATYGDPVLYSEDPEYGLGVVGGFLIGLTVGLIIGITMAQAPETPASDQEEVYKQLRQVYGETWISSFNVAKDFISSILPADTGLWSFTSSYWNRAAELVVSDIWSENGYFDPDTVVDATLLRQNLQNYIYNWQATVDKSYNNSMSIRQYLTGDCYGGMSLSINWQGGNFTASSDMDSPFTFDMTQIIENTSSGTMVYIDANQNDTGGSYDVSTSGTLYNFGNRSVTLTTVSGHSNTSNTITINPGSTYTLSPDESGMYRIETSGATIAGPFSKAANSNAAEVLGGIVLVSGEDSAYMLPDGNNMKIVKESGTTYNTSSVYFSLTFDGTTNDETRSEICDGGIYNLARDWNNLIQQINDIVDRAAEAGEVMWSIFDITQESSGFLSPSSITQTVNGISLSTEQQKAVYIQAMKQAAGYWQDYGDELTEAQYITNLESQGLIVYGDIYYNGELWAENVIFTPYMTVSSEQTITVGQETQWSGAGFAMVWAQVDRWSSWDGSTSSENYELIDLDSNFSIVVENMEKDGMEIDTITLTPTVIDRYTTDPSDPNEVVDPVNVLDAASLIVIIMILVGIIIFLVGYILGQPVIGLVVALIVMVFGVLFSETIASIALGTFTWSNLFG